MFYQIKVRYEGRFFREYKYDNYKEFIKTLEWLNKVSYANIFEIKIGESTFKNEKQFLIENKEVVYIENPFLKEDRIDLCKSISDIVDVALFTPRGFVFAPYYNAIDGLMYGASVNIRSFVNTKSLCFEISLATVNQTDRLCKNEIFENVGTIKKDVYLSDNLEEIMKDIVFDLIDSIYKNQTFYNELICGKHPDYVFEAIEKYCQEGEWENS